VSDAELARKAPQGDVPKRRTDAVRRVAALTGAGISTDSGIPDFRGPQGIWTLNPEAEKLATLITQNTDGLHQRAGTPADRVLELHGTIYDVECVSCGDRTEMAAALDRVRAGEEDPPCIRCGGTLKAATVMFGQQLDPDVFERAVAAAEGCDLFLAIGSTLTVEPAASLCLLACRAGARLVIVNRDPTPYDRLAADVVREPIGEAIPAFVNTLIPAR
jgi:NAD-dependent deacetylase